MSQQQDKFNFLETYIQKMLDENGFAEVSEETRNQYLPQFLAEAEQRLGLAVLPLLDEKNSQKLENLLQDESLTQEQLQSFWYNSVPNFEEVVSKTLQDFSQEFQQIIGNLRVK